MLKKRLEKRPWSEDKVRENVEAEAIDTITIEALDHCNRVYELDVTEMDPKSAAREIVRIVEVERYAEKFRAGKINWSEEVMKWY